MGGWFWGLGSCVDSQGVATLSCIPVILHNVVVFFLLASAFGTLFMLIIAGIKFATSGGSPDKVGSAKSSITYAIVGLALVFLSFVIIQVIATITGNHDIVNGGNVHFQMPADNMPAPSP